MRLYAFVWQDKTKVSSKYAPSLLDRANRSVENRAVVDRRAIAGRVVSVADRPLPVERLLRDSTGRIIVSEIGEGSPVADRDSAAALLRKYK